jgi:hypothetical protein
MAAVWLWRASGWSGVCGDEGAARAHADALLHSGAADRAVVEEARIVLGSALERRYDRTGRAWQATAAGWRTCPPLAA